MSTRLVQAVLASHALDGTDLDHVEGALLLRPDQVMLGGEDAPVVLAVLEAAGIGSVRVSPTIADPGRVVATDDDAPGWQPSALRVGMRVPRPGHGDAEVLHRDSFASPGRLMLCVGRPSACGAFGMLALTADAFRAAAALAGGPLVRRAPRALRVELAGPLAPATCGVDLALSLLSRLRGSGEVPEVLEIGGAGVGGLSMSDRMAAAWLLADAGVVALFPSDETTRSGLAAAGRDQDWRRLEAGEEEGASLRVSLAELEPLAAPLVEPAAARPVGTFGGTGIERVLVGPGATRAELRRIASVLEGQTLRDGVEFTVVAGSRALLDQVAEEGLVARLAAAGVRVVGGEVSAHAAGSGTGLCLGVPRAAIAAGRGRWLAAGAGCCAASALAGVVMPAEPREEVPDAGGESARTAVVESWLVEERDSRDEETARVAMPTAALSAKPDGYFRGEVLAVLGDGVGCSRLIGAGARGGDGLGRAGSFASRALSVLVPDFVERARERRGGFLVAGEEFAAGEPGAAAALGLAESGVKAVLARSFAGGAPETLVHAGVLPLVFEQGGDPGDLECGDELELPGMPESLAPDHPLLVRDLTRGTQHALRHGLDARGIAILRAGGLVPFVARRPRQAQEQ